MAQPAAPIHTAHAYASQKQLRGSHTVNLGFLPWTQGLAPEMCLENWVPANFAPDHSRTQPPNTPIAACKHPTLATYDLYAQGSASRPLIVDNIAVQQLLFRICFLASCQAAWHG